MSDEAVLRIVLKDEAKGSTTQQPATPAGSPPQGQQYGPGRENLAAVLTGANALVGMQDRARSIIAGAGDDLKRFQKDQAAAAAEAQKAEAEKRSAGMDSKVRMQDMARDILAGAEEDLGKFKEESKKGPVQKLAEQLINPTKSLLSGDIGGAAKGLTGNGGLFEGAISEGAMAELIPAMGLAKIGKEVTKFIGREIVSGVKTTVGTASAIGTSIASVNEDVTVPMAKLGDVVSSVGEKLAETNPVLGGFVVAVGESGKALATLMQALDQTAKYYGQYNLDIAAAQSQAEASRMQGDFDRASKLGPGLAVYTAAKSKLEQDVEDIKTRILEPLLPIVSGLVLSLDSLIVGTDKTVRFLGILTDIITAPMFFKSAEDIKRTIQEMLDFFKESEVEKKDPTTVLFQRGAMVDIENT